MARVEVTMPKMGESITEGTVIAWHKAPGDAVEADETLLEIGTDKVDTDVPAPASGVLKEILVQEGDTVDVGTAIAVIETEVEEGEAAPEPVDAADGQPPDTSGADSSDSDAEDDFDSEDERTSRVEAASDDEPEEDLEEEPHLEVRSAGRDVVEIVMPKMGESITEGTIITWHKQVGDTVEEDEVLLEIATDKVDTDVPSPAAGVLREILVQEGETVEVGTAIARVATGEAASAESAPAAPAPSRESQEARRGDRGASKRAAGNGEAVEQVPAVAGEIERKGADGRFYSPLVRSIAEKEGLSMDELVQIEGTGREGRVTKADVMAFLKGRRSGAPREPAVREAKPEKKPTVKQPRPAPAEAGPGTPGGRVEIVEMDRMRQIIAEHMVRSKATSAHVTSFAEADVTNLVRLRERNKQAFLEREGVKLTYTPFFVQAAVEALHEHPLFNASVEENRIILKKDFHVGIAVAIARTGLVAPVIRHAGDKNLVGLARAAADLADRARNRQLQPDELQGGTFTITNIGSLGSIMGTPIINQPQVAILATGAIKKRPVVVEDPNLGDIIAIRHMMYLSLSYDHRIIDGAMGSSFLQKFVSVLEGYDPQAEL